MAVNLDPEILIIDDGSTDDTPAILRDTVGGDPRVRILSQRNQGHLASLNRGVGEVTGDVIFLLDGDDSYQPTHIADCLQVFSKRPEIDLVSSAYRIFGGSEKVVRRHRSTGTLGASAIAAMAERYWAVGPTSCLAFRSSLARRIFPYPDCWIAHGVHVGEAGVVLGSSVLGARQYFLDRVNVNYRSHGTNFDLGRRQSPEVSYRIARLSCEIVEHFRLRAGLPADFSECALSEFQTWSFPGRAELRCYARIIWRGRSHFFKKCEMLLRAWKHYRRTR